MYIPLLTDLLTGTVGTISIYDDGSQWADNPPVGPILSGAFNPLHNGHLGMASAAAVLCGEPAVFELAVRNADKGAIAAEEITRRATQFTGRAPLILSAAPLFAQKAKLYPGRVFVIGYDTAARMLNPHYYGGDRGLRDAFDHIRGAGCRFLVAGRLVAGRFLTLADLRIPAGYADLVAPIPEHLFRADISSTELRGAC